MTKIKIASFTVQTESLSGGFMSNRFAFQNQSIDIVQGENIQLLCVEQSNNELKNLLN